MVDRLLCNNDVHTAIRQQSNALHPSNFANKNSQGRRPFTVFFNRVLDYTAGGVRLKKDTTHVIQGVLDRILQYT